MPMSIRWREIRAVVACASAIACAGAAGAGGGIELMHADCGLGAGRARQAAGKEERAGRGAERAIGDLRRDACRGSGAPSPWRRPARRLANSAKQSSYIRHAPRSRRRNARRCRDRCCLRRAHAAAASVKVIGSPRTSSWSRSGADRRRDRRDGFDRRRQDRIGRQRGQSSLGRPPAILSGRGRADRAPERRWRREACRGRPSARPRRRRSGRDSG